MNGTSNEKAIPAKKKRQGRFNFIDFILIVILIGVIAALVYVFSPQSWIKDMITSNEKNITYVVEITNVDAEYLGLIKDNDIVVDSVTKSTIGKVSGGVDYNTKYIEYVVNEETTSDGDEKSYVIGELEYPDKYTVTVTIEVTANYAEKVGYTVNSTRIAVGEKMYLKFPEFVGEGYCIGIIES